MTKEHFKRLQQSGREIEGEQKKNDSNCQYYTLNYLTYTKLIYI